MNFWRKINDTFLIHAQAEAKTSQYVYPLVGGMFLLLAVGVSINEIMDNNPVGGLLVFVLVGGFGSLFFIARRINQRFLEKTRATDKTYKNLLDDFEKALKDKP